MLIEGIVTEIWDRLQESWPSGKKGHGERKKEKGSRARSGNGVEQDQRVFWEWEDKGKRNRNGAMGKESSDIITW